MSDNVIINDPLLAAIAKLWHLPAVRAVMIDGLQHLPDYPLVGDFEPEREAQQTRTNLAGADASCIRRLVEELRRAALAVGPGCDAAVARGAAAALGPLAFVDSSARSALFEALHDEDDWLREAAALGIARNGGPATECEIDAVIAASVRSDGRVRYWTLRALSIQSDNASTKEMLAAKAVPVLIAYIEQNPHEAEFAARILATYGEFARPAVPILMRRFDETTGKNDKMGILLALARIMPKAVVPEIVRTFQGGVVDFDLLDALVRAGGDAAAAGPALAGLLERGVSERARAAIHKVLDAIGFAPPMVSSL